MSLQEPMKSDDALLYAAPMEGVTGFVWRAAHRTVFGGADKYFAPFVVPDANMQLQNKELRELSQGENDLVPQILTNRADYFVWCAREMERMGYREVNLHLGCPSGTVAAKHKGSGMLREPEELDAFLGDIFAALPDMLISVKTRIGISDSAEWENILPVFEKYPIHELTVHPRVQKQFYDGVADREIFRRTAEASRLALIYNGDIFTPEDEAFGFGCGVMAGRGLAADPALFRCVRGGGKASRSELTDFHSGLIEGYREYMSGDLPLIHRMRELWHYLAASFIGAEPHLKRMNKAKKIQDYMNAADNILRNCEIK